MGAVVRIVDVVKDYYLEGGTVHALRGVSLEVEEGDFVALMGPSGSGKSTLLNVLGCLDRPTAGEYYLGDEEVARMEDDQLSEIRSLYLGFIFQSYNLLAQYTVVENIEVPLLYQGRPLNEATRARCTELAGLVGLGDRLEHRPTQLSGGQQQRVAIARALVNDPHVILADEPTGNLDSRTSDEIMALLSRLNAAGKTIIMVTHENDIAAWARRVVRMRDGHIESDVRNDRTPATASDGLTTLQHSPGSFTMRFLESLLYVGSALFVAAYLLFLGLLLSRDKGRRTLTLALRSLWLHKMRAMLSVLGIIIGTGAVIALMSFGEGSMQDALDDIKRQGATNLIVRSVEPPDDISTQSRTFVARYGVTQEDYDRFHTIPTIIRMVPMRIFSKPVYHDQYMWKSRIVATTPQYADINNVRLATGRFLVDKDTEERQNVCVLGSNVAARLFPFGSAIDEAVLIDKFNYVVIGVTEERMPTGGTGGSQAAEDFNNDLYIPMGTAEGRFGKTVFTRELGSRGGEQVEYSQVTLTVADTDQVRPAGEAIKMILDSHPRKDTELTVPLDRLEQAEREKDRFTMLMAIIGGISLVVGGIGIMNIMLATVTERTREIGIRRALGAKRRDITMQFLIEAVVQTTIGGLVGMGVGLLLVVAVPPTAALFDEKMPAKLHEMSIVISLAASVVVGVAFGLYPAYRAALLDPIEALRHE